MAKEVYEKFYVCSNCSEEVVAKRRPWTCPCCGEADTFELSEGQYDEEYDEEDEEDEEDY